MLCDQVSLTTLKIFGGSRIYHLTTLMTPKQESSSTKQESSSVAGLYFFRMNSLCDAVELYLATKDEKYLDYIYESMNNGGIAMIFLCVSIHSATPSEDEYT